MSSALLSVAGWVLLLSMTIPWDAFVPLQQRLDNNYGANNIARLLKLTLLGLGVAFAVSRWAQLVALFRNLNKMFVAFLLLVPLSYLWSISPNDTMARYVTIVQIVAVWTAVCVCSWEPRRLQSIVRPFLTFVIIGSILYVLAYPDMGIEQGEGTLKNAWRGLPGQKNIFGQLASLGWIFWFHGFMAREVKSWKVLLFGGACGACVFLSRSSTSLFASILASGFLFLLLRAPPAWKRYMPYLVGSFAIVVVTYAMAVLNLIPGSVTLLGPIASLTGKDMTFSNRSVIWDIIKDHIALSPLYGSGYGAYWIGPFTNSPSYTFITHMYFYPSESHNGYLEIVNDLGFVGMIMLIGFLAIYVRQSLSLLKFDRVQAALYLGIFFQQAIMNLSESTWLAVNSASLFTIVTFAVVSVARSCQDARNAKRANATNVAGQQWPRQPAYVLRK